MSRADGRRARGGMSLVAARALLLVAGLFAAVVAPATVAAASPTFGTPTATSTFGKGIEFRQPVTFGDVLARAELLVEAPMAPGPNVTVVEAPGPGSVTLAFTLDSSNGELLPNTMLTARWRLVAQDGTASVGPSVTVRYEDTRFAWQTRTGSIVRVHWYQGGSSFGSRALQIGEDAVAMAGRLLGVTETKPVDFFIYADQQDFYGALGPGTRENVGGQAVAELRTLYALITPAEINAAWVGIVIPHELTHLVFDTAVRNPYHFPPRWLNEGLAVYLSQGYDASDRSAVERAARDGTLMPLPGIASQFPTTRERFGLAYAESVSAVDYLVREKGEAALVALIRSYAKGVTDDEAFRSAIGMDAAAFDAAWRSSVGARDAVAHGPAPAPTGPVPADWLSGGGSVPASPASGAASGEAPLPTRAAAAPGATGASGANGAPAPGDSGGSLVVVLLGAGLLAVGIGVGVVLLAVRVQRSSSGGGRAGDPPRAPR